MFRNEKHLFVSPQTHWSKGLYCLGWINIIVFSFQNIIVLYVLNTPWITILTLTVIVSSSENSFLNFPGIFCRDNNRIYFFQILGTSAIKVAQTKKILSVWKKGHPYLPCLTEAANSCSVQAHYNGKETVEVPLCFTAIKNQWSTQFSYFQLNSTRVDAVYWFATGGGSIPMQIQTPHPEDSGLKCCSVVVRGQRA